MSEGRRRQESEAQNNVEEEEIDEEDLIPQPPDGGYGWVIMACCFFGNMVVDGISYSFGLFMESFQDAFQSTEGQTALVGSLCTGMYLLSGPFVSGLVNRFGSRAVMMAGSVFACAAFVVSIFSKGLVTLLLTYGILGGFGFGMIYLPATVHVGQYFERRRAIATGIAVAGSGFGAFVFSPLCVILLENYGWQGALLIQAGLILNCAVAGALLRPLRSPLAEKLAKEKKKMIKLDSLTPEADHVYIMGSKGDVSILPTRIRRPDHRDSHGQSTPLQDLNRTQLEEIPEADDEPVISNNDQPVSGVGRRQKISITPRDVARSMAKLSHQNSKGSMVLAEEFSRPLYRSDVFLAGSIRNLEEFHKSGGNLSVYRKSTISIPNAAGYDVAAKTVLHAEDPPTWLWWLPRPVRDVCRQMLDIHMLSHPVMLLLALANIFSMLAFYTPYVYIVQYAVRTRGIDYEKASFLLSVIGICNTAGRVVFGWIADRRWITALTISNLCILICGALTALVPLLTTYTALNIYAALFGFFLSSYISLTSIILCDFFGIEKLTNAFGLVTLFRGITSMCGAPLTGAIYDSTGSYTYSFLFAGALMFLSFLTSATIPLFCMRTAVGLQTPWDYVVFYFTAKVPTLNQRANIVTSDE